MDNSQADVKAGSATSGNPRLNQSGYGIKQMLIICLVILTIANLSFPAFLGSLRIASAATLAMPASQTSDELEKQQILEKEQLESNYGLPIGAAKSPRPAGYVAPQTPGLQVVNTFNNPISISIPISPAGAATPYPSTITVTGALTATAKVTVTLNNFSHTYPADVQVLLVGPQGQSTMLMSNVGGAVTTTNVVLTFDDAAATTPPTPLVSGTYKPVNNNGTDLTSPAPAGPYPASLAVFNNTNPNGTWSLYVNDTFDGDGGSIANGWSLSIDSSATPVAISPTLTGVAPYFAVQGSAGFSATISGTNFTATTTATVNGTSRPTTFVNTSTLTVGILANDLTASNIISVGVSGGANRLPIAVIPAMVYSNSTTINIPDGDATPYPSTINVSGASGTVSQVVVSLFNYNHTFSKDVDILLVGPQGQRTILLSDAGNASATFNDPAISVTLILDDMAPSLPATGTSGLVSGRFKPSNFAQQGETDDNFTAPAPTGPYSVTLSVFSGTVANGNWSLYVHDDTISDTGNIMGGWALSIIPSGGVTTTNPVPTLIAITPTTTAAGSSAFTLTVTGTNFISSSVINFNGTALTTTFVNSNTLTATVSAALVATAGTVQVSVTNPAPGGGTSNSLPFVITGGGGTVVTPTLTAIFPYFGVQGSTGTSLTVTGTNFVATSTVNFNGSPRPTTFVSANTLIASILATDLLSETVATITVSTPPTSTSVASRPFAVIPPTVFTNSTPITINDAVDPNVGQATPYPSSISVTNQTGVVSKIVVSLFGFSHSFGADVDILLVGPQGQTSIVQSDAGGFSSFTNLTIVYDDAASTAFTTTVLRSGVFRPTDLAGQVGDNSITDTFPTAPTGPYSANFSTFNNTNPNGTWSLYVVDDDAIGSGSIVGGWALSVITAPAGSLNPTPVITTLNPSTVGAGSATFTLTITGSGFITSSLVNFGGQQLVPTSVTSNTITVIIPATSVLTQGTVLVTVFNPAPGGGTSNSLVFTIGPNPNNTPLPAVRGLTPFFAVQGSAGSLLTITGTGFVSTSVAVVAGTDRPTTFVNTSTLTTLILATDLTVERVISVSVRNPAPGGGSSNNLPFAVIPATVYSNTGFITITDNAAATPYPSTINVTGATGVVSKVVVTLFDVGHTFLSDIDILLVGPQGQRTLLLSDSFGSASISDTTFVFDQAALTTTIQFFGGVLPPVNNDTTTDVFPAPAPAGPYSVTLNVFNNTDPNGTWSLYVRDGASPDAGFIRNGWALSIVTTGTTVISNTPTLIAISPISVTAGSAGISLTVTGTNFITNSVVRFSGSDRPTTFVSVTGLIAALSAADFITPGTYTITVFNPGPNGGVSNALTFTVVPAGNVCTTPYVVTRTTDDSNCGSLRFAITSANTAISGTARITVTFNVTGTPAIVVVSSTLPTLSPNVSIVGPSCSNPVTIQGQGTTGAGLTLSQGNTLQALIVRGFGGPQIDATNGGGNRLVCVQARLN